MDAFDRRGRRDGFENGLPALLRVGQVRIGLAERFRFHEAIIAGIGSGYTRFSGGNGVGAAAASQLPSCFSKTLDPGLGIL
jgi:hypothetical protein